MAVATRTWPEEHMPATDHVRMSGGEGLNRREVEDRLYRAIRTLAVLPDQDQAYLDSLRGAWPQVVHDLIEAYGWAEAKAPRFRPTATDVDEMLPTLDWLAWLGRQNDGRRDVKIISARAFNAPWWKIAGRFGRSERTIQRWHDDAIALIQEKIG